MYRIYRKEKMLKVKITINNIILHLQLTSSYDKICHCQKFRHETIRNALRTSRSFDFLTKFDTTKCLKEVREITENPF